MMNRGDQIIYIPDHADGDEAHPDCEYGFIWEWTRGDNAYCMFWLKGQGEEILRATKKGCHKDHLRAHDSVDDRIVLALSGAIVDAEDRLLESEVR